MTMSNEAFVEMANPHSWLLVADNLHSQAIELGKLHGNSNLSRFDFQNDSGTSWDSSNRSIFLLSGFALENALKAFLVYENPEWISNGIISKNLRSHSLTALSEKSKLIPYKARGLWVLKGFEDGLESWARYPCGLSKLDSNEEQNLSEKLWAGYQWLVPAYGRRLKKLLAKNWKGPHGFNGRYEFQGAFLGT